MSSPISGIDLEYIHIEEHISLQRVFETSGFNIDFDGSSR